MRHVLYIIVYDIVSFCTIVLYIMLEKLVIIATVRFSIAAKVMINAYSVVGSRIGKLRTNCSVGGRVLTTRAQLTPGLGKRFR